MKKIYTTLLFGAVTMNLATAAPRSAQQALSIAKQQAARMGASIKMQNPVNAQLMNPQDQQEAPYYVFDKAEGGFVIVSGEDKMPAIVGYADRGRFDVNNLPDGLRDYLQQYAAAVARVAASNTVYGQQGVDEGMEYPDVEPMLGETIWDQNEPFNLMLPICPIQHPETGQMVEMPCVTGCGTTAAAQIMYYHKYPAHQPNIPGYTTASLQIQMPAIEADDTEAGAYDWNHMLPDYKNYTDFTEQEAMAVAKLMLHVGCAQQMDYTPNVSGAQSQGIFNSFSLMGYDASLLQLISRENFTKRHWLEVINNELNHQRPIEYMGYTCSSGHAFVLDGCDGEGYYHINWGWSGLGNGYYDIAILDPETTAGSGASATAGGYHIGNYMLIGITPENAQGEQMQEVDFKEPADYNNIQITITDADGGNNIYYNPNYVFSNPLLATVTNNTDREVNSAELLYVADPQNDYQMLDPSLRAFVGFDLDAHETQTVNFEMNAPTTWFDAILGLVSDDENAIPQLLQFNTVQIDDPDLYFEVVDCNVTDQIVQIQSNMGLLDCFVVNDTVLNVSMVVNNAGGTYRGTDFGIGMLGSGLTIDPFVFEAGTTEMNMTFKLTEEKLDAFVVYPTNQAIPAHSEQDALGLVLSIPVFCHLEPTGIELNKVESVAGSSKRMINGRLVIEQDGKRVDILGRVM